MIPQRCNACLLLILPALLACFSLSAQPPATAGNPSPSGNPSPADPSSTWTIHADSIDPHHYYGITVANGMIGLVSSADPFRVKDIVLNGAFDLYGRGRVSNILKTFNFINAWLEVDNNRISSFS
jgi:hypothetical protein